MSKSSTKNGGKSIYQILLPNSRTTIYINFFSLQIIRPEELGLNLEGFGFSFAEYYPYEDGPNEVNNDPDDNNYPGEKNIFSI